MDRIGGGGGGEASGRIEIRGASSSHRHRRRPRPKATMGAAATAATAAAVWGLGVGLLLLLGGLGVVVEAYPHYLLNPEGCKTKKLEVGFKMMAYPAIPDKARGTPIKVYRRGQPLLNGSEYRSGESLTVRVEGRSGQYCLEVKGPGLFVDGACSGKRVTQEQLLGMPMGERLQDMTLVAGLAANEFAPVVITKPFLLRAPGSTPPGMQPRPGDDRPTAPTDLVLPDTLPRLEKTLLLDEDTGMELSWMVAPDQSFVDIQVAGKGKSWVSIGVIEGRPQMITTPAHKVLLFPNEKGEASLVELKGQRAAAVIPVPMDKREVEVLLTEAKRDYTLLRYRLHATKTTGILGAMLNVGGSNTLLYAHGEKPYPEMHNAADAVTVQWDKDGGEAAIGGVGGGGTRGGGTKAGGGGVVGGGGSGSGHAGGSNYLPNDGIPGVLLFLLPLLALLPLRLMSPTTTKNNNAGGAMGGWGRWLLQGRLWRGFRSVEGPLRPLKRAVGDAGAWRHGEAAMALVGLGAVGALAAHWYQVGVAKGFDPQRALAVASGKVTITALALTTLPAAKSSLWLRLLCLHNGPGFERVIKFHKLLGRFVLLAASAHLALSLDMAPLLWAPTRLTPVAPAFGLAAYACLCLLALSAVETVRRRVFEAFQWLHYVAALAVFVLAALHLPAPRDRKITTTKGGAGSQQLGYYLPLLYFSFPLFLHALDLAYRMAQRWGLWTGPLAATARALPSTRATQLTLTHPAPLSSSAKKEGDGAGDGTQRSAAAAVVSLSSFGGGDRRRHRTSPPITPGQYYLVSVPAVAGGVGGEWHPFSVAVGGEQPEGPEEEEEEEEGEGPQAGPPMSFVVKDCGEGTWTHRLYQLATTTAAQPQPQPPLLPIQLQGPYGSLSLAPLHTYTRLLFLAGGVGVTPMTSTLYWLRREARAGRLPGLLSVELVWVVKEAAQAEWCAPFLLQLLKESPLVPFSSSPSSTNHTTMPAFPTTPTTPSPRRRRRRQQQSEAVAVAVVPNTPQRQPQWALHAATASLPFRLRLFVTGTFTPRTPRRAANNTGGERGADESLSGALPSAPGRLCVPGVLDAWAAEGGGGGGERLGLVVCGPEGLGMEARHWAVRRGVDLHEEVFHW